MPTHDIIDNRSEKLIDHLNQILGTSERARFAVGYLFTSAWEREIEIIKNALALQKAGLDLNEAGK